MQSDSQPSHSSGDKHSQIRSDVCSASRFSLIPTFKKSQVAEKVSGVNSKAATGNIDSLDFSAQSISLKPPQERVKLDLNSTREVESKVPCQINESLQHPCIIQGDTGKLALDDAAICTSEKISTFKCEELQSNSELLPSCCKNNVQEGNMSDDYRDEKRKSCCSVEEYCALQLKHGPIFKDSMDSPVQGSSGDELTLFNNCSQLKVGNAGEEDICTTNGFSGGFHTLDVDGQLLNECVHPGNEDEMSHSTENVAKQSEVMDSFGADPAFPEDFSSIKSDVDDLSSSENQLGNTESVLVPSAPAEACNYLEENVVSSSIPCGHDMVYDGQAVLELEKTIEVSGSAETNCQADFIGPFTDCKDWLRESEEQQFSYQLVPEVKEGGNEIDVLTRNERADEDDGPDMQIDYFTGCLDVEQNMEQVKLLMPSSAEVRMEMKPLESSHETFSEIQTSEMQKQHNCSSIANTPDVKTGCVMKQTDQLGKSDGCSPAKDAPAAVFFYSNEEPEDNSELEDMDLVTESDCSDEEPEDNLELKEVYLATESELISDRDEFSVKGILQQEYPQVESIHTALDQSGKTKTPLSESISSPASTFGDPGCLNEDTNLSKISEGMSKEDSNSGRIEHNYVGKAKSQTDTDLRSHEEEEVKVIRISPDPVAFATREEESGTPIPMNEAFSVGDVMQPNELNVLSDDTLTSECNGAHASESSSSCTCASEGKDQMIPL